MSFSFVGSTEFSLKPSNLFWCADLHCTYFFLNLNVCVLTASTECLKIALFSC